MSQKKFNRIAGLGLWLIVQAQSGAFAESLLEEGTRHYKAGDYDKAGRCFQSEVKANPHDANAHYLLGNVFLELHRHQEAAQEYRKALSIDGHGPVARYAQQGLASIEKIDAGGSRAADPHPSAQSSLQDREINSIRNSAHNISNQTNETESHASTECAARIRDITRDTERRVADLEKEMQEKINSNGEAVLAPARLHSRNTRYIYNPAADNQEIRDDYGKRIAALKDDESKKITALKLSFSQKQSATEDSAQTLDKEYLNRKQGANVKLAPAGTNLFVRSYETAGDVSGSPVPLALPAAKRLPNLKSTP